MSILNFNTSLALGDTRELECQNCVISSLTSSVASYQNVEVYWQMPMFHFEEDHQFSLID